MNSLSSLPAREKSSNGARHKSAKSTAATIASVITLSMLSACGEVSNWWQVDEQLDVSQSGNAPVQSASAGSTATSAPAAPAESGIPDTKSASEADVSANSTTSASAAEATDNSKQATQTTSAAGPTGDYRPDGYDTLFFGDEFNGTELDRTKWCTRFVWGGGPPLQVADAECTKFPGMGVLDYARLPMPNAPNSLVWVYWTMPTPMNNSVTVISTITVSHCMFLKTAYLS